MIWSARRNASADGMDAAGPKKTVECRSRMDPKPSPDAILALQERFQRRHKDVAMGVSRFTAAALGLMAFAASTIAGLFSRNPVESVLTNALWAMIIFAFIGLGVGMAADVVIREYSTGRKRDIRARYDAPNESEKSPNSEKSSTEDQVEPMGT